MRTAEDRFWEKVDKSGECWLWTAGKFSWGYGAFSLDGKVQKAHRVSYRFVVGDIPEGSQLDHICHIRACVNPAHLRPVTQQQNAENRAGAQKNSKTGVRGVSWDTRKQRWHVQVCKNRKIHRAGYFRDFAEAEAAAIQLRNALFTHNEADRLDDKGDAR